MAAQFLVVHGNLLDQDVDVIVNAWNRNVLPWWMLLPQGVSGAIKKRAGLQPFRELAKRGPIPLGGAVLTGPGKLPFRGIIHVAGISLWWRASERSVHGATQNAVALAAEHGFQSIAFPLLGAGTGGQSEERVLGWMQDALQTVSFPGSIRVVRFRESAPLR